MKKFTEEEFVKLIDELLTAYGKHFRGIRLRCSQCGDVAFASDTHYAEVFGWTKLVKAKGSEYSGLCIDCGKPPKVKTKPKSK